MSDQADKENDSRKTVVDDYRAFGSRVDGWENPITNIGTSLDKATATTFAVGAQLADQYLENIYHGDHNAALICDYPGDQSFAKGHAVNVSLGDQDKEITEALIDKTEGNGFEQTERLHQSIRSDLEKYARRLKIEDRVKDCWAWSRLFGGAVLLLGVNKGGDNWEEPLDLAQIKSFDFLNVIDKRYIHPWTYYEDIGAPNYGEPELYRVSAVPITGTALIGPQQQGSGLLVHESRVVRLRGTRTTNSRRLYNNGFDLSALQRVAGVLSSYGLSWAALDSLIQDAKVGVFKMPGLIQAYASQGAHIVDQRMAGLNRHKSVTQSLVLDEGEEYTRHDFTFAGLPDVFQLLMLRLSSAARLPVTVLMGRSPAGENATGESDFRALYDYITDAQENTAKPALERIYEVMFAAKDGPTGGRIPRNYEIYFPSLWTVSPKEEAEIRKLQAETDAIYVTNQVVLPEEIATSRFGGEYTTETNINIPLRLAILQEITDPKRAIDDLETPTTPLIPEIDPAADPNEAVGANDDPR